MPRPAKSTAHIERAVRRHSPRGMSDADIARRLGLKRACAVGAVRKRLGIPRQGKPGVPKGTRSNPSHTGANPLPECWGCGKLSERCHRYLTLEDQGWYVAKFGAWGTTKECYCLDCLVTYGPPSVWAVDYIPSDEE